MKHVLLAAMARPGRPPGTGRHDRRNPLPRLKWLNLEDMRVADIGPLAALSDLEVLSIRSTDVADLGPLQGHARLCNLNIGRTKVVDLSPLADLPALETLDIFDTKVTDLSPLMGLPNLHFISMMSARVADLRPLLAIPGLWHEVTWDRVSDEVANRRLSLTGNFGLDFAYCAATEGDRKLAQLSMQRDEAKRARMTRACLRKLPPWPERLT
jgi:Leucine-rich repeat (LRR) protein